MALFVREYGAENARAHQHGMRAINPSRIARDARTRASALRAQMKVLRELPIDEAAKLIEAAHADQERTRQQAAKREQQLRPFEHDPYRTQPGREGPALGL